ncbi:UNVERIFIED_CONTAM: hypothetical protein ABIE34_003929 [Jeotgalibacillus campisalis]
MTYLLDANVFVTAKNAHYGFDFVPGFWEWIEANHNTGKLRSVDKVGQELLRGHDDLAKWAKERPSGFFAACPPAKITPQLAALAAWASSPEKGFKASAISEFLQSADYHLVAHAAAEGYVVVTHETPAPDSIKRVKIPDACRHLGVPYINPFDMLRTEQARFR